MSDSSKEFKEFQEDYPDDSVNLPLVKSAMLDSSFEFPDLSQAVMAQFAGDLNDPLPCQYDFEFISTYFDNQLHLELTDYSLLKSRIEVFEKHLPLCAPCNEQLGLLIEISQQYRNHLYRLEGQLEDIDLTTKVMVAYQQSLEQQPEEDILDEHVPMPSLGCGQLAGETVSAFIDNELDAAGRQSLETHLKVCQPCQEAVSQVVSLHQGVASYCRQLLEAAPALSLWPAIEKHLLTEAASDQAKVVPIARNRKKWAIITTTAVAASFLYFLLPLQTLLPTPPAEIAKQEIDTVALEEAMLADQMDTIARQQRSVIQNHAIPVIYQSPEAYLFAEGFDLLPESEEDVWSPADMDVSAFVLNEYP